MMRWLIRSFLFACGMIAIRIIVGYLYPEWGGKELTKAIAKVIPVHHFISRRDQVPLATPDYTRFGFPVTRPAGSWLKYDLADFHQALESLPREYRASYPGADGEYGKSVFSKITKLETTFNTLSIQEQGEVIDLIAKIHEVYRHAHNIERILYDREIALLRGVYIGLADQLLGRIEMQVRDFKDDVASATGIFGYGNESAKIARKTLADTVLRQAAQSAQSAQSANEGLSDMRKNIELSIEETASRTLLRPQAKKLILRYFERHLASVSKHLGGDYTKSIEKGYRRASDPEIKELYRRILVTL